MTDLPKGWATATINDLIGSEGLFTDGDWVESKDQDPEGANRLLQLADIGDGVFLNKSSRFLNNEQFDRLHCTELKEGDVLVARMPAPLGRACLMPAIGQRCLTVVDIAAIRVGAKGISNKWLMHFINAPEFRLEIESKASGTTRKRISRGNLGDIALPVPPSAEQVRITTALDDMLAQVDTLKARLDALPALIKRFRQSVLTAAVSGELTEEIPKKNESGSSQGTPLSVVVEDIRYGTAQKCAYGGGPTGVLRIPNISGSGIDLSDLKSSNFSHAELEKLSLNAGDIVLIRSNGSVDLVGKSAVVTEREEGLLFAGYLIRIRLKRDIAEPAYINYWLKSPKARTSIENKARSTSGVNNINSQEILSLELMIPNLAEQKKIVRRADQLFAFADQLEARLADARQRVDALTQSILAKAFRGELVPQDPNDEPASVLLERIAAQRAADPKPKRGRAAKATS